MRFITLPAIRTVFTFCEPIPMNNAVGAVVISMFAQTANSKKAIESKKPTGWKSRTIALRAARLISQTADNKIFAKSNKFAESNPRTPIPSITAGLLSPQSEPSCEPETTGSNADECQKLDYNDNVIVTPK